MHSFTGTATSTMWVRGICERFDHLNRPYYDPTDRTHGYMETKHRSVCRAGTEQEHLAPAISMLLARPYAPFPELASAGKAGRPGHPGSASSISVCDGQTMLTTATG